MAISYITGIPGSGKSYYAVYKLWEYFIKENKNNKNDNLKSYNYAYTNINKFNYSICDKIKLIDFDIFLADLTYLYGVYKDSSGNDDEILIKEAKSLNLFEVLIVIDEAHNFLTDKEDIVLKWWLTYHRHLGHDIWLITQDLSLIATGYKSVAEFFYKAIPSSRRLLKSKLKYSQFNSYKMYKKDFINKITIPAIKDVFSLYHSGSDGNSKSIIYRFIKIFIFLAVFLSIIFYFFLWQFKNDIPDKKIENNSSSLKVENYKKDIVFKENKEKSNLKDGFIFYISCIDFSCSIVDYKFLYSKISYNYLSNLIISNNPIYTENISSFNGSFSRMYVFKENIFENLKIKTLYEEKKFFDVNSSYSIF